MLAMADISGRVRFFIVIDDCSAIINSDSAILAYYHAQWEEIGILGNGHKQKFGAVFYEFGGYVSGKHSYILDQHTLRCFAIYESSDETIASARSLELIDGTKPKHIDWMNSYKEFYEAISTDILCDKSDFLYSVDRLLFGAGKLIKLSKSAKAKRISL
jgi:hypothetical protein